MRDIDATTATARPHPLTDGPTTGVRRHARPGDVLFAGISPSMENGKLATVPDLPPEVTLVVSNELFVLRPRPGVDARLVESFLRQDWLRRQLAALMTGTAGRPRLDPDILLRLEVGVPGGPTALAARLEAIAALDRAAATCRLIAEQGSALPAAAARKAAEGARRVELRYLVSELVHGSNVRYSDLGSTPVLGPRNVVDGLVDRYDLRLADGPPSPDDTLRAGDLLIVAASGDPGHLGRAAVYEGGRREGLGSQLIRVRCRPALDADFLWAWLQTGEARAALLAKSRGDVRPQLDLDALADLPVAVPGSDTVAAISSLARSVRRLRGLAADQLSSIDRSAQAQLAMTFARADAQGASPDAVHDLPRIAAAASEDQRTVWAEIAEISRAFALDDLSVPDVERAALRHTLAVFEQIGLVLRERVDGSDRWRLPHEADLDVA